MLRDLDQQMEKRADDGCTLWIKLYSKYEYEIRYHPGRANVVIDALRRKERVKPRRVRAVAMTIRYGVRGMILTAQSEAFKQENVLTERLHGLVEGKAQSGGDRQKSYADNRRKPLEFEVGYRVMLKVSPWKGDIRFGKKGKFAPRRYISAGMGYNQQLPLGHPGACQDAVDHMVLPGYFLELRHLPNEEFLNQYNVNLARQVAMGSLLRLRFEQEEVRSLRAVDTEVQGLRNQTRNLETLLDAEVDMKKAAEANSVELTRELESLCAKFSDLQVNNNQLSQQVSTLQAQVTGDEQIKAAFEEFKKREDDQVEKRCAKMNARLDALSIDFDEKLYPYMLTAITGRRWVIGHGLRLAVMKCTESTELRQAFANVVFAGIAKGVSEGLKHRVEHGKAYRAEKKKKCRVVCHTHGIGSAHYPRSDGIPVSVPTVAPQGLAILLTDAAIRTKTTEDEAPPRLIRSKSLPPMYNLDWP
ncbi:hypothetical protein Tco_1164236 [Tanacetum coccineum]